MTPTEFYYKQCKQGVIQEDPLQLKALQHFDRVYRQLMEQHNSTSGMIASIKKVFFKNRTLIKGLYLWGGVGIGKTFLMDCFYQCIPFKEKIRMHFHQFMRMVHQELTQHQGIKDPLNLIAKEISKKATLICFDELFVSDITDAMLLGRLFKALFNEKVCLVTTSNIKPDDLYKNGLQREQFLPAIDLLNENTEVVHIPTSLDYRLRHLKEAGVFYTPLDDIARNNMKTSFAALTSGKEVSKEPIVINGRQIPVIMRSDDVIWFDFSVICKTPRSQKDYLSIAEQFSTVFVSDIPVIPPQEKDTICLFVSMVDVFYDARVRIVISAAEPVGQIYNRGYMILEYTRTHSRLLEMQSLDYFSGEESFKL